MKIAVLHEPLTQKDLKDWGAPEQMLDGNPHTQGVLLHVEVKLIIVPLIAATSAVYIVEREFASKHHFDDDYTSYTNPSASAKKCR